LKVINKTDDISRFDTYQQYINGRTEKIKVAVYYSLNSPNHKPHYFHPKTEDTLAGILNGPDVQRFVDEKLNAQRIEFEWTQKMNQYEQDKKEQERQMKEQEAAYRQQLQQQEESIRELEQENKEMATLIEDQQATIHANSVKWGTTLATGLERFLVNNAMRLQRMPLIGSLAGLFLPGTDAQPVAGTGQQGSEMNYEMSGDGVSLTEGQQRFLALYEELSAAFNEQQAEAFYTLLLIIRSNPQMVAALQQNAFELAKAAHTQAAGSTEMLT
jgi:hypothetical protein